MEKQLIFSIEIFSIFTNDKGEHYVATGKLLLHHIYITKLQSH